jgi:hypothetical protein
MQEGVVREALLTFEIEEPLLLSMMIKSVFIDGPTPYLLGKMPDTNPMDSTL